MIAYIGPESVSAVASGVAAFLGFLLLGWRWILKQVKRPFQFLSGNSGATEESATEVDDSDKD